MTPSQFIDQYGWDEVRRVVKLAGTSKHYFYQIATGRRNASYELAQKLRLASDGRLDVEPMVVSTPKRRAWGEM